MYYGKLVELATSEELFKNPLHPYTKSLLSAVPHPDPNIERNRVRQSYDASSAHDYSVHKPSIREIVPGHFVYCNDIEAERYLAELNK
jgi:oligopeptide transport system ATP-binding protein